jgi:hypothetical protein
MQKKINLKTHMREVINKASYNHERGRETLDQLLHIEAECMGNHISDRGVRGTLINQIVQLPLRCNRTRE